MIDRSEFYRSAAPVMALYAEGRYLDALDVTNQLAQQFPDEAPTTTFWQLCLLSRAGKVDEALALMSEALGSGLWWSETVLRAEEDLASLQGNPQFESMVVQSAARHAAAQVTSRPDLLVRLPDTEPPYPLLIALHGRRGSPGRDLARWDLVLPMGWMLAMPRSSQLSSPNAFHWDDAAFARQEIAAAYQRMAGEYALDTDRVIVAGFSQGAATAVQLAVRRAVPARGFLAVAPGPHALAELEEHARSTNGLRGYLVAGGNDPNLGVCSEAQSILNRCGVPCELEVQPGIAHEFPPDFEQSLRKALRFLFA